MAMTDTGIIPFGEGPRSDHAIIYGDLSLEILSSIPSQSLHDPTHPSTRKLWSTDIKAAEQYVDKVKHGFSCENIIERITILVHRCNLTQCCTDEDARILNKIDTDITKILLAAESQCKKAKGHAWSPLLANAGRTVIAAKWHLSNLCNGRLTLTLWNRAKAILQAKAQLKEAYAMLRKVQQDAQRIQDSFLDD
jgi:translation initiation factor 2B subunit (eIF-2B alpha/beta/delta family)